MIKGTVVEQYKIVEPENLKKEIDQLAPILTDGKPKIIIDHCFDVKGVGTVILGKVVQGKIKQYDTLKLFPKGVDVMIKSIQMHDDTVADAVSPARVGIAAKGVTPDDIQRGDVLCIPDTSLTSQEIEIDYVQSKFFKDMLAENQMFLVSIGLQIRPTKIVSLKSNETLPWKTYYIRKRRRLCFTKTRVYINSYSWQWKNKINSTFLNMPDVHCLLNSLK